MKRFLSLILVLSLALSLIALPAMAEGEEFTITVNLHGLDKSGGTANKIGPKHAEETTGVKINYYELDSASAGEKINIMLASGDLPDAFLSLLTETQVVSNLPLFVPLNEYLNEENAPNLMKMFEKYPELIDMITQVDGNIYTLSYRRLLQPRQPGRRHPVHQQGLAGQAGTGNAHHYRRVLRSLQGHQGRRPQRQRRSR